jgi:hypothetical protein
MTEFISDVKGGLLGARCNQSASIRHGSWFQQSKLTLQEIILLTYIVCREPATNIQKEYRFSWHTIAHWGDMIYKAGH